MIKVKLIHPDAKVPDQSHATDAGYDLYVPKLVEIGPGETKIIPIGIVCEIPVGFFVEIRDKSSIGSRGIIVVGGIIDCGYRGEWKVCVHNLNKVDWYTFVQGNKIAQAIIQMLPKMYFTEAEIDIDTQRGEGGFGSTGS